MLKGNIHWHVLKSCGIKTILATATMLKIYKGVIPSSANNYLPSNKVTDLLLSYTWTGDIFSSDATKLKIFMTNFPAPAVASASGVATWFAIEGVAAAGQYPYLLGEVSDVNGSSILKLIDNNIIAGTAYDIYSLAFEIKQ